MNTTPSFLAPFGSIPSSSDFNVNLTGNNLPRTGTILCFLSGD